jgi:transcription initiation factor TFIID subunit 10
MPDPSSTLAGSSPALLPPNGTSNSTTNTNAQAGPSSPPRNTYTTSNDDIPMNGETTPRTNGDGTADMSLLFTAKREEELARRDRSLAEFLVMLDGYKPVVSRRETSEAFSKLS